WRATVGYRADEVGFDRSFLSQFHTDAATGVVDRATADHAVGTREIDMLENAEARWTGLEGKGAEQFAVFGDDHLAGFDLTHEFRTDDVEGTGLGREHPATLTDTSQHQRAHAERV